MTREDAQRELEAAAFALGEKFHNEIDASWDECQRFERAALEFYRATRTTKPVESQPDLFEGLP